MPYPDRFAPGIPPEARYANYFEVGYRPGEFVMDFGQSYEGPALRHTRIVINPLQARTLCEMLCAVIAAAERELGGPPDVGEET